MPGQTPNSASTDVFTSDQNRFEKWKFSYDKAGHVRRFKLQSVIIAMICISEEVNESKFFKNESRVPSRSVRYVVQLARSSYTGAHTHTHLVALARRKLRRATWIGYRDHIETTRVSHDNMEIGYEQILHCTHPVEFVFFFRASSLIRRRRCLCLLHSVKYTRVVPIYLFL